MRGVDGEFIFRTDEDRAADLAMLAATVKRYRWHCLSYCQMGTHLHLLIEQTEMNFSEGMRWLHGHYASSFNRHHDRDGHLFPGRYHDEPILTEAHLVNAVRYIVFNPVEAGLCRDPREWRWGSHGSVAAGTIRPWLAHGRLVKLTNGILGPGSYERLTEGSGPFGAIAVA
jgi:putative transposase